MSKAPLVLLLAALAACDIPEEDFPDAYGGAVCDRLHECDKGSFENTWADPQDCVDTWADLADAYLDVGDLLGGEYSPSKARDCVTEIRSADCGAFTSADYECEVFE